MRLVFQAAPSSVWEKRSHSSASSSSFVKMGSSVAFALVITSGPASSVRSWCRPVYGRNAPRYLLSAHRDGQKASCPLLSRRTIGLAAETSSASSCRDTLQKARMPWVPSRDGNITAKGFFSRPFNRRSRQTVSSRSGRQAN